MYLCWRYRATSCCTNVACDCSDVFTGVMDFSGMSLIKLKKEEMEAQVSVFMRCRNLQMNLLSLIETRYQSGSDHSE